MPAYPAPKSRLEFVRLFKAKVESGCSINALSITMSRYERALAKKRKKTYVPLGLIAAPICKRYGITIEQLKYPTVAPGKRRTKDDPAFYDVRAEFCRAAREKKFSYLEI